MLGIFIILATRPINVTSFLRNSTCTELEVEASLMATWQKYQCRLWGDIIKDHRQRRVLHSQANDHVRLVFLELLSARLPNKSATELQEYLSPADPSTPGLNQSYICKYPCFSCYPARACAKGLSNRFFLSVRPVKNFKI